MATAIMTPEYGNARARNHAFMLVRLYKRGNDPAMVADVVGVAHADNRTDAVQTIMANWQQKRAYTDGVVFFLIRLEDVFSRDPEQMWNEAARSESVIVDWQGNRFKVGNVFAGHIFNPAAHPVGQVVS